jgi:hypothetical protein
MSFMATKETEILSLTILNTHVKFGETQTQQLDHFVEEINYEESIQTYLTFSL